MALVHTPAPELGLACPDFRLPATDGRSIGRVDLANGKPFLVMFICNHCPYVKAIEDRLVQLGHDFAKQGMKLVGISSNDPANYPEDNFESMTARAQAKSYSFPYLFDETQEIGKLFGAVCTPDYFLYDAQGKLAYRGRLDDAWKDPSQVTRRELWQAALDLLEGGPVRAEQIPSMGCSIKWKGMVRK